MEGVRGWRECGGGGSEGVEGVRGWSEVVRGWRE